MSLSRYCCLLRTLGPVRLSDIPLAVAQSVFLLLCLPCHLSRHKSFCVRSKNVYLCSRCCADCRCCCSSSRTSRLDDVLNKLYFYSNCNNKNMYRPSRPWIVYREICTTSRFRWHQATAATLGTDVRKCPSFLVSGARARR